jgi:glycosyltransferase involved in cell wall biosynthesis
MFGTDPAFLFTNRYIPLKLYKSFELEKNLMMIKRSKTAYENIFWLNSHSPLKPVGNLASKIQKKQMGNIIFDFFDDDFLDKDRYGKGYTTESRSDYHSALKTFFSLGLTLFIHEEHRKFYLNEGFEIKDYLIIPNASDPNLFKNTPLPKSKVVGHIGSFASMEGAKTRGLFLLLDAFELVQKEHKNAKLLLCGDFADDVKQIVEKRVKGWDAEIYWSRVSHYWVPNIFEKCYAFVRPTLKFRKDLNKKSNILGSVSGLDAAAATRPVVSTNQNAIVNNNGFFCERDPEDMAEKICKLLDDRKLATELGLRGREAIENEHNWENRARVLYEHITKLWDLERPDEVLGK